MTGQLRGPRAACPGCVVLGEHLAVRAGMAQNTRSSSSRPLTSRSARTAAPSARPSRRAPDVVVPLSSRVSETETADGKAKSSATAPRIGDAVRRQRALRGLTVEALATRAGLSEDRLAQIEAGTVTPTIKLVWSLATALGVPFSSLLSPDRAEASDARPSLTRRPLLPTGGRPGHATELHELTLAGHGADEAPRYPSGTLETLLVTHGRVIVRTDTEEHVLTRGESLVFRADALREYVNPEESAAVMYAMVAPAGTEAPSLRDLQQRC